MAYLSQTMLVAKVITRLRMVQGAGTQLYAEDAISQMLEETYEMVRVRRWWDHLMAWEIRQLDAVNGFVTTSFAGARERFKDVQHIFIGNNAAPMPIASSDINPYKLTGTLPRFVEPLNFSDDPTGVLLFRIWPKTAVTTTDIPLRIRLRADPANVFIDPAIIVPFDSTCLINGAAMKYAADDGSNPASVATLQQAFDGRLMQLERQHDDAVIMLDPRQTMMLGLNSWAEYP